jgi:hypothetical protein
MDGRSNEKSKGRAQSPQSLISAHLPWSFFGDLTCGQRRRWGSRAAKFALNRGLIRQRFDVPSNETKARVRRSQDDVLGQRFDQAVIQNLFGLREGLLDVERPRRCAASFKQSSLFEVEQDGDCKGKQSCERENCFQWVWFPKSEGDGFSGGKFVSHRPHAMATDSRMAETRFFNVC